MNAPDRPADAVPERRARLRAEHALAQERTRVVALQSELAALRAEAATMRGLVEELPQPLWLLDAQGRYVYVNRAFEAITASRREECLGRTAAEWIGGEAGAAQHAEDLELLRTGGARDLDTLHDAHGFLQTVVGRKRALGGADPRLIGWIAETSGLSDRQSESERARERLESALFGSSIAIWEADARTGEFSSCEAWLAKLGLPAATRSTGAQLLERAHPDDRARLHAMLWSPQDDRFDAELRFRTGAADWIWTHLRGMITARSPDGRPLRWIGTVTDVTARKRAEADLLRAHDRAERAERRLRGAIEALPDGFVLFDADDRLVECNEIYRRLHQPIREHIVAGERFETIIRAGLAAGLFPEAAGREAAWREERLAQHRAPVAPVEYRLPDGRWVRATEARTPEGGYAGVRVDVTAIRHAQEQAEAANRAKSEFLANMSHEIRTPLNGILGVARLLLTRALPEDAREYVELIEVSGTSLLHIINEILDLSKIEANRLELVDEDFSLRELLVPIAQVESARASAKGVALVLQVAEDVPDVWRADALRLRQVLVNLVGNAIKFTRHGEVGIHVRVARHGPAGAPAPGEHDEVAGWRIGFEVRDTGIGIPADKLSSIFEAFTQADSSINRRYGGTGLGLAICLRLLRLMGGEIRVASTPGVGSSFAFEVPMRRSTLPPAAGDAGASRAFGRLRLAGRPPKVLVAEDNPINQRLVRGLLQALGCELELAEHGARAVELHAERAYDAILMDMQMPVMDGLEAARQIRLREAGSGVRVPIIALTANASAADRSRCLDEGMDDFVPKPLDPAGLAAALARCTGAVPEEAVAATPVAARSNDGPRVLDLDAALGRMEGDRALLADVIRAFVEFAPGLLDEFGIAVAAADVDAARRVAHTLRGSCGAVGADALAALAGAVEANATADAARIAGYAAELGAGMQATLAALKAWVKDVPE